MGRNQANDRGQENEPGGEQGHRKEVAEIERKGAFEKVHGTGLWTGVVAGASAESSGKGFRRATHGVERGDAAQTERGHIMIDGLMVRAGRDDVSLMPDTDISAEADEPVEAGPGGDVPGVFVMGIGVEGLPVLPVLDGDGLAPAGEDLGMKKTGLGAIPQLTDHGAQKANDGPPAMNLPRAVEADTQNKYDEVLAVGQ